MTTRPEGTPEIPTEARFVQALGLDPEKIVAGSVRIEWSNGGPVIIYTSAVRVDPLALGMAFVSASDGPEEETGQQQPGEEGQEEPQQEGAGGGND